MTSRDTNPNPNPRGQRLRGALAIGVLVLFSSTAGCWCETSGEAVRVTSIAPDASAQPPQPLPDPPSDPVVATIGTEEVLRSEVTLQLSRALTLRKQAGRPPGEKWKAQKRRRILFDLIDRRLLAHAVAEQNIDITDAAISDRLAARIETRFQTRASFVSYLDKIGMAEAEYKSLIRDELAVEALTTDKSKLEITEAEARTYYQRHKESFKARSRAHLAVIVLKIRARTPAEEISALEDRARELSNQAQRGANFADLARRFSEGPTAARGGDLGWVYATNLDESVAARAFRIDVGAVSEPIRTRLGLQIIHVIDRRPEGYRAFDEVQETITRQLKARKLRRARDELIVVLKRKSAITLHLDRLTAQRPPPPPTPPRTY